jgi:hypothetical protein
VMTDQYLRESRLGRSKQRLLEDQGLLITSGCTIRPILVFWYWQELCFPEENIVPSSPCLMLPEALLANVYHFCIE